MSLYHKYRPKTLNQIYGNEQTLNALRALLLKEDMPQAFLFHGPRGCGKTTMGRIVAMDVDVIDSDYREVDSADFRGVDTIREIRKNMGLLPMNGGAHRAWLLDECHKMTGDAQSALLKALEDTPPHVIFILCTTDPQKLLPTIRDRCAQFPVSPLSENQMLKLLREVVKAEGDVLTRDIYQQITQDSFCHPRAALQILEQVLAVTGDDRLAVAKRTAEIQSQSIELCRALIKGDSWNRVSKILQGLREEEPESIRRHVLSYCETVMLKSRDGGKRAALITSEFIEPFYNTGWPGLTYACFSIVEGN